MLMLMLYAACHGDSEVLHLMTRSARCATEHNVLGERSKISQDISACEVNVPQLMLSTIDNVDDIDVNVMVIMLANFALFQICKMAYQPSSHLLMPCAKLLPPNVTMPWTSSFQYRTVWQPVQSLRKNIADGAMAN